MEWFAVCCRGAGSVLAYRCASVSRGWRGASLSTRGRKKEQQRCQQQQQNQVQKYGNDGTTHFDIMPCAPPIFCLFSFSPPSTEYSSPSFPPSLPPFLPPSLRPSLPPSLPPSVPPSLPPPLPSPPPASLFAVRFRTLLFVRQILFGMTMNDHGCTRTQYFGERWCWFDGRALGCSTP